MVEESKGQYDLSLNASFRYFKTEIMTYPILICSKSRVKATREGNYTKEEVTSIQQSYMPNLWKKLQNATTIFI